QSTPLEADPWWEVDLGEQRSISAVRIWKRTDNAISADMDGFALRILDADRQPVHVVEGGDASEQPVVVAFAREAAVETRRAAIRALVALEGNDAERLALFETLLQRGVDQDLAVAGADTLLAVGNLAA